MFIYFCDCIQFVCSIQKGAPVKKELLLKVLRSKQLQTEDIVTVIRTNGVDFGLTDQIRRDLIAAGARPQVINAVSANQRISSETFVEQNRLKKLRFRIMTNCSESGNFLFKDQKNPANAVRSGNGFEVATERPEGVSDARFCQSIPV